MRQKGYTILEFLIVILLLSIAFTMLCGQYSDQREKKATQFEKIFKIDLRPHMAIGFKALDPEAKETIQKDVTKKLVYLQGEYFKVWLRRKELKEMSPSEYGSAKKQAEKLKKFSQLVAKKWGPYMRAKEVAEWWYFDTDLPEMPDQ